MLHPAVPLDAEMTAAQVLTRLAANGFWLDSQSPAALARMAGLLGRPGVDVALIESLRRDASKFGAAIRRQWGAHVLWYARGLTEVLSRCVSAAPETRLLDALDLHESDSSSTVVATASSFVPPGSVLMDGGMPIAVSVADGTPVVPMSPPRVGELALRGNDQPANANVLSESMPQTTQCWPRIDAPASMRAEHEFVVRVGFAAAPHAGTAGGVMALPFTPVAPRLEITIELSTGPEVQAMDGWSRTATVAVDRLEEAQASFNLIGREPDNREGASLTTLHVRYILAGTVCGTASRPLVILPAGNTSGIATLPFGTVWTEMPETSSPMSFEADPDAPDLTLELFKSDGNAASGRYECKLLSRHRIETPLGPFAIDIGQDARTLARQLADDIRVNAALTDLTLKGFGQLVADRLPAEFFDALSEVSDIVKPEVPAVLIISGDHYVPWELAWIDPPLDANRPRFLGAQAVVGRWLRNNASCSAASPPGRTPARPPASHPRQSMAVRRMAVMAGWYKDSSGMRRLPQAEQEARKLAEDTAGLPLRARPEQLRDLLEDRLQEGFENVQVQAVHFAGHGAYNPVAPGAWTLYLEDGSAVQSTVFRAANFGGDRQPLLFLNACMLGIGGETIGDMAGFPGHSLRGGFGGVLAALWEIDDQVAHDIAIEFWARALPPGPGAGEPIGQILRDLRARYVPDARPAPISTYLAYVYYGHPRLTLKRVAAPVAKTPP